MSIGQRYVEIRMEQWFNIGKDEISSNYHYYVACSVSQNNQLLVYLYGEGSEDLQRIKINFGSVLFYSALEEGWDGTDLYLENGFSANRPNFSEGVLFEVINGEVGDIVLSTSPNYPMFHYYIAGFNYHIEIISMNRPIIKKESL